jgi:hypothetical protein
MPDTNAWKAMDQLISAEVDRRLLGHHHAPFENHLENAGERAEVHLEEGEQIHVPSILRFHPDLKNRAT